MTEPLSPVSQSGRDLAVLEKETPDICSICGYPWSALTMSHEGKDAPMLSLTCTGCQILRQIYQWLAANRVFGAAPLEELSIFSFGPGGDKLPIGSIDMSAWINSTEQPSCSLDLFTLEDEPRMKIFRLASFIPPDTSLSNSLRQIKTWLKCCVQGHSKCNMSASYVPLRLLDLDENPKTIKLVDGFQYKPSNTDTDNNGLRYACLSHCWGKTRCSYITTRTTIKQHYTDGIPVHELPRTFRDAISVARAIGIRYIWIDTFCIIQDDREDWTSQVPEMINIYQHAYITLAASASKDNNGGFFREPINKYRQVHHINITGNTQTKHNLYLRESLSHPSGIFLQPDMPLLQRGWAFQERLLSKRYLSFGRNELLWECLEDVACSCSVSKTGFNMRHSVNSIPAFNRSAATKFQFSQLNTLAEKDVCWLWYQTLEEYSFKQLSIATDKLAALDGIISFFKTVRQDSCTHGHWHKTFADDLIWTVRGNTVDRDTVHLGRPRTGIPSWSWVSAADVELTFASKNKTDEWEFQVKDLKLIPNNLSSQPTLDHVKILGQLFHLSIIPADSFKGFGTEEGSNRCYMKPLDNNAEVDSICQDDSSDSEFGPDYKFWSNPEQLRDALSDIYFLVIRQEMDEDSDVCICAFGMVLKCVGRANGLGMYERIGIAQYSPFPLARTCKERSLSELILN